MRTLALIGKNEIFTLHSTNHTTCSVTFTLLRDDVTTCSVAFTLLRDDVHESLPKRRLAENLKITPAFKFFLSDFDV